MNAAWGVVTLICLSLTTAVGAQDPIDQSAMTQSLAAAAQARAASEQRAQAMAQETEAVAGRLEALRQELVIAAYAVQDAETVVASLNRRIAASRAEYDSLLPELDGTQRQLFQSVLALQAVARDSPLARLVSREDPNDVLRAGIVMSTLTPELQARAQSTASRLQALRTLDQTLSAQLADVALARDALAAEQARLAGLRDEVDAVYESQNAALAEERARADGLAAEVDSLSGLVAALRLAAAEAPQVTIEIAPLDTGAGADDGQHAGRLAGISMDGFVAPIRGDIVGRFGETMAGIESGGLTLAAPPGAQVVSPFAGHVAYAGAFPGRGLVLIIDHGRGYHSVLTGLVRIDTAVGRQLLAGEPVGVLGGPEEISDGAPPDRLSQLYYELRRNGVPIDPMPWYSTVSDGING